MKLIYVLYPQMLSISMTLSKINRSSDFIIDSYSNLTGQTFLQLQASQSELRPHGAGSSSALAKTSLNDDQG